MEVTCSEWPLPGARDGHDKQVQDETLDKAWDAGWYLKTVPPHLFQLSCAAFRLSSFLAVVFVYGRTTMMFGLLCFSGLLSRAIANTNRGGADERPHLPPQRPKYNENGHHVNGPRAVRVCSPEYTLSHSNLLTISPVCSALLDPRIEVSQPDFLPELDSIHQGPELLVATTGAHNTDMSLQSHMS